MYLDEYMHYQRYVRAKMARGSVICYIHFHISFYAPVNIGPIDSDTFVLAASKISFPQLPLLWYNCCLGCSFCFPIAILCRIEGSRYFVTMARWFRSEPMEYISFIVNEDAAHDCLADLGRMGVIQFTDVSRD